MKIKPKIIRRQLNISLGSVVTHAFYPEVAGVIVGMGEGCFSNMIKVRWADGQVAMVRPEFLAGEIL